MLQFSTSDEKSSYCLLAFPTACETARLNTMKADALFAQFECLTDLSVGKLQSVLSTSTTACPFVDATSRRHAGAIR